MTLKIELPQGAQKLAGDCREHFADGNNVGEALDCLVAKYPSLESFLYEEGRRLRAFVQVFINDRNIRTRGSLACPVATGDRIRIITALAGG